MSVGLVWSVLAAQGLRAEDDASPARVVSVEVVIAEYTTPGKADPVAGLGASDKSAADRLKQLAAQGQLGVVTQVRLSSLERQVASLQVGETTPVATGRTIRGGGPPGGGFPATVNYSMVNVGTLVRVTPHVDERGAIVLALEIDRSRLAAKAKAEGAVDPEPARTVSITAKSTLLVPPGQTVLLSGAREFANDTTTDLLILVSGQVSETPQAKPKAAATSRNTPAKTLNLLPLHQIRATDAAQRINETLGQRDLSVAVEERTNSLLVLGDAAGLQAVKVLIAELDK